MLEINFYKVFSTWQSCDVLRERVFFQFLLFPGIPWVIESARTRSPYHRSTGSWYFDTCNADPHGRWLRNVVTLDQKDYRGRGSHSQSTCSCLVCIYNGYNFFLFLWKKEISKNWLLFIVQNTQKVWAEPQRHTLQNLWVWAVFMTF